MPWWSSTPVMPWFPESGADWWDCLRCGLLRKRAAARCAPLMRRRRARGRERASARGDGTPHGTHERTRGLDRSDSRPFRRPLVVTPPCARAPRGGPAGVGHTHGALRVSCLSRLTMLALALPVRPRNWYLLVWLGLWLGRSIGASVPRSRALAIRLTIMTTRPGDTLPSAGDRCGARTRGWVDAVDCRSARARRESRAARE